MLYCITSRVYQILSQQMATTGVDLPLMLVEIPVTFGSAVCLLMLLGHEDVSVLVALMQLSFTLVE